MWAEPTEGGKYGYTDIGLHTGKSASGIAYRLDTLDLRKLLAVEVTHRDASGAMRVATSAPVGPVVRREELACRLVDPVPEAALWIACMITDSCCIDAVTIGYSLVRGRSFGALSETEFRIEGADYAIRQVTMNVGGAIPSLQLTLDRALKEGSNLVLRVADRSFRTTDVSPESAGKRYIWPAPRLDWKTGMRVTLTLSLDSEERFR